MFEVTCLQSSIPSPFSNPFLYPFSFLFDHPSSSTIVHNTIKPHNTTKAKKDKRIVFFGSLGDEGLGDLVDGQLDVDDGDVVVGKSGGVCKEPRDEVSHFETVVLVQVELEV